MKKEADVEILLEGLDENNISSVLTKWKEISEVRKKLEELDEMLKSKVKAHLKERHWNRYVDSDTKISVTISNISREIIDKQQLQIMLTDAQYAQVIRKTTFEKMSIITPEARVRMKNYVKKPNEKTRKRRI